MSPTLLLDLRLEAGYTFAPFGDDNVWTSPTNKTNLQRLVRQLVSTPELVPLTVVLSGCMMDEGFVPAQLLRSADPSLSHHSDPTYAEIT